MAGLSSNRTPPAFQGSTGQPAAPVCPHRTIPRDVVTMVGGAFSVLIAVGAGSLVTAQIPGHSPMLFALAYLVPAAVAFGAFWVVSRRF